MRQVIKYIAIIWVAVLGVVSCIYPFNPKISSADISLVVVEGDISAGVESSFVATKSLPLNDNSQLAESLNLTSIYVEGERGSMYKSFRVEESEDDKFLNSKKVTYKVDTRALKGDERHRLVFVYDNKTYASDWVTMVQTPEIDSVTFRVSDDLENLEIMGHAVGINDSLRYYKWDYVEDWEFHANYEEHWVLQKGVPVFTTAGTPDNYYCWNHNVSSEINICNTENISKNIIKDYVVKSIWYQDRRISSLYRIDVYLRGLTKEGYKYWETMLKNNEATGDIFAPQPNEMRGNLHCVENPDEVVLGYITSCSVSHKRIYINQSEHRLYKSPLSCQPFEFEPKDGDSPSDAWGVYSVEFNEEGTAIIKTTYIDRHCLDCLYFGTKNKPADWPTDHE